MSRMVHFARPSHGGIAPHSTPARRPYMRFRLFVALAALFAASSAASAQSVPAAIFTDPPTNSFVHAIQEKGGHKVTAIHVATDHAWSDHRIALESTIITWLAG